MESSCIPSRMPRWCATDLVEDDEPHTWSKVTSRQDGAQPGSRSHSTVVGGGSSVAGTARRRDRAFRILSDTCRSSVGTGIGGVSHTHGVSPGGRWPMMSPGA
eukprot:3701426-Prymnesium_polylepis.1